MTNSDDPSRRREGDDAAEPLATETTRRRFLQAATAGLGAATVGWSALTGDGDARDESGGGTAEGWLRLHEVGRSPMSSHEQVAGHARRATVGPGSAAEEGPTDAEAEGLATAAASTPADGRARVVRRLVSGTRYETPVYLARGPRDGPTTFVVGGMHGDERAGHEAAAAITDWRIERGRLFVVPAAHAPALERGTRNAGRGDLNRKFPTDPDDPPEGRLARALWSAVVSAEPDWVFDLHSSYGIYRSGDGGVGQAVFPTAVDPAPTYAARTVDAVNDRYDLRGVFAYRTGQPLGGDRPMLLHRVKTTLSLPGAILETTERATLDDQVEWHLTSVDHLMNQYDQPPERG